jgi:hypothetical protein
MTDTHERITRLLAQAHEAQPQARLYLQRVWTDTVQTASEELNKIRGPLPGSGTPLRRVEEVCRKTGVDFRILDTGEWDGSAASAGYYEGGIFHRVRVRSGFSIPITAHVALHEFTHAMDGQAQGPFDIWSISSGRLNHLEIVTETVAALISTDYGIDSLSHSVAYIANHMVQLRDRSADDRYARLIAVVPQRAAELYERVSRVLGEAEDGIAHAA